MLPLSCNDLHKSLIGSGIARIVEGIKRIKHKLNYTFFTVYVKCVAFTYRVTNVIYFL